MSKKEELIKTYMSDIQLSSSKQKFGFFSIPPSPFAGSQQFQQKKPNKNQNGKVKTQQRNILSGLCASGVLKKSYFSYPEYKTGQPYMDPGKIQRLKQMKESQKFKDKQTFRPASLNKTICTASYEYVPHKQTRKDPKLYKTEDGKIKTENPNITSNPASKINYKSHTQLKYISDPYDNARVMRRKQLFEDISKRGQNAFRGGSPVKDFFCSNKDQYNQVDLPQKKKKQTDFKIQHHDSSFRPAGNHFNDGMFSYPKHVPQESGNIDTKKIQKSVPKNEGQKKEPFRLIKQEKNSKPCPSISLSKMNLMRCVR